MTITNAHGSYTLTESQLEALANRFAIRYTDGERQFFVDGKEVSEQEYAREAEAAGLPSPLPKS